MTAADLAADLKARARNIVQRLAKDCTEGGQTSHLTPSIYNTAWVSMILKSKDGQSQWLFPECFQFILDRQTLHGGWHTYQSGVAANSDGVINTMAALLALQTHRISSHVTGIQKPRNLDKRINEATSALQSMLQDWDITSCGYAGFEIIVPTHLQMLEQYGTIFSFPGRDYLLTKQQWRLAKLKPEFLYGETASTLLYYLEALIGKLDFDRVSHHKNHGSMMSSPSSTAAYLMHASVWDDESEDYLRSALMNGAVPEICPFNLFELTWTVETLLAGGMTLEVLGLPELDVIADYIESTLLQQKGIVGWAPGVIGEADDTSNVIYILNLLGHPMDPDQFLANFESKDRSRSLAFEGESHLSSNSHVLKTLLHTPKPSRYQAEILEVASIICDCWWDGERGVKQSMTELYSMMLISQALISLLALWDKGHLPNIPENFLKDRLRIVVFGILVSTLKAQNLNGSWGMNSSRETTAYALIILATTASLPLAVQLNSQLKQAIDAGRHFLLQVYEVWSEPDYVWQGKTTYGSGVFVESFIIAGMNITTPSRKLGSSVERLCELEDQQRNVIFARFIQLPIFSDTAAWLKEAAVLEGYLYKPLTEQAGLDVFPRRDISATKHFEIVPFLFTAPSHVKCADISPRVMFQLMVSILLLFQIDNYMEAYIAQLAPIEMDDIRIIIDSLFDHEDPKYDEAEEQVDSPYDHTRGYDFTEIRHTLSCFVNWFVQDKSVLKSSTFDQALLRKELRNYVHAQLTSIQESSRLINTDSPGSRIDTFNATETFYDWVHTTSAQHIGIQLTFALLSCLLGSHQSDPQDCFPSVEAKYFAQDLAAHLGVLARMENDYGSVIRDFKERNLNSVNFPEFSPSKDGEEAYEDLKARKAKLKRLAGFERECYEMDLRRLEGLVGPTKMKAVKTFCNFVDLAGQIYAVDDFTPKIEKP